MHFCHARYRMMFFPVKVGTLTAMYSELTFERTSMDRENVQYNVHYNEHYRYDT